ncbi:lycopene beta-cyclase [Gordonia hirsuta DSM 44140 = NBRC 16056]|uniref:Lycopene beta-cyclase n=1 Tax=Gordonia hirsuta DSM 44140 = NBRC 16056 TaxID=1121927 RepID=L7L7Z4_9ACTN|nr:lycopene cyclase family protein [Gordonia hirsuta]GAC57275.1 lycopene beta-cyclase [Gordonia hirsuta DSM 44140 = NBRC 16056]
MTALLVVGAGPAGRALAHRGLRHGLQVTIVDPDPDRIWTATIGMFVDDLPPWLPTEVIACSAPEFVVYTPARRQIGRGYCVLAPAELQRALSLTGATVVRSHVEELTSHTVRLPDGRLLAADHVVDARGGYRVDTRIPRQRASGTVFAVRAGAAPAVTAALSSDRRTPESEPPEQMVLMDWRDTTEDDPSFSYRVGLGGGRRLVEETCLAGRPATSLAELARRNRRWGADPGLQPPEEVDFPLYLDAAPWRRSGTAPLRFGAAGGLMHPATGYSIATALQSAEHLAAAIAGGADPHRVLWSASARWTHRLRMLGLAVLLGFGGRELSRFFDVFFSLPVGRQRAYLSRRDRVSGIAGAMWSVFWGLDRRGRLRLIGASTAAAGRQLAAERRARR